MITQKKILLVSSDDECVATFKNALNRYDVELIRCSTYGKAIELAQSEHYDLVLVELFISADGDQESFDSYSLEMDILENDIRLLSPFREDLIRLRNIAHKKNEQKLFPLGARLSNEMTLMLNRTILFLNIQDQSFDCDDLKAYLDRIAIYYNRRGNNVYFSPWGYTIEAVNRFVEKDVVEAIKCEKVY